MVHIICDLRWRVHYHARLLTHTFEFYRYKGLHQMNSRPLITTRIQLVRASSFIEHYLEIVSDQSLLEMHGKCHSGVYISLHTQQ